MFVINQNVDDKGFKNSVYNKRVQLINIALGWEGISPKKASPFEDASL